MSVDETAVRNGPTSSVESTMDLDEIAALTDRLLTMVRRGQISRLDLSVGTVRWQIETGGVPMTPALPTAVPAAPLDAPGPAEPAGHPVVAPLVGVLYLAPQPGAAPFVTVGQRVAAGQQVAIIEAMKMMNEVTADRAGVVREIHVPDGTVVEFGERLFSLDPA